MNLHLHSTSGLSTLTYVMHIPMLLLFEKRAAINTFWAYCPMISHKKFVNSPPLRCIHDSTSVREINKEENFHLLFCWRCQQVALKVNPKSKVISSCPRDNLCTKSCCCTFIIGLIAKKACHGSHSSASTVIFQSIWSAKIVLQNIRLNIKSIMNPKSINWI